MPPFNVHTMATIISTELTATGSTTSTTLLHCALFDDIFCVIVWLKLVSCLVNTGRLINPFTPTGEHYKCYDWFVEMINAKLMPHCERKASDIKSVSAFGELSKLPDTCERCPVKAKAGELIFQSYTGLDLLKRHSNIFGENLSEMLGEIGIRLNNNNSRIVFNALLHLVGATMECNKIVPHTVLKHDVGTVILTCIEIIKKMKKDTKRDHFNMLELIYREIMQKDGLNELNPQYTNYTNKIYSIYMTMYKQNSNCVAYDDYSDDEYY